MHQHSDAQLVGTSVALRTVLETVGYAALTNAKVLITGESGVGKEIVAHRLHAASRRADAPFITLNCAGVPESLLESELFGHTRGSFTGAFRDRAGVMELAHGGTLFMDEVGEMSLRMQALLLRFLETGEIQRVGADQRHTTVDVRLVTATNRDLQQLIRAGAFREDLYYRLNVIHIIIPPLRERKEDVPLLVQHFLEHYAHLHRLPAPALPPDLMEPLLAYHWPGNVRELRNMVERLLVGKPNRQLTVADLPVELRAAVAPPPAPPGTRDSGVDRLYERLVSQGESFWTAVYEPFMQRDLTRDDLRALVTKGLKETHGSYMNLLRLFNLDRGDYKRFLNVLHKHGCHLRVAPFRAAAVRGGGGGGGAAKPQPLDSAPNAPGAPPLSV
jgi:transcriptional regulator with PAS, ATPase and Fis domain